MSADVFISYSSNDQDRVVKLADRLRAAGVSIWVDESGIGAATLWSKEIAGAIKGCKVLVLMVTPNSVTSKNVVKEVSLAAEQNKQILPVILEPTQIPEALEYHLAGIQHLDVAGMSPSESSEEILPALQRLLEMENEEVAVAGHAGRGSRRRSSNIWSDWRLYVFGIVMAALVWIIKPDPVRPLLTPKHSEILIDSPSPLSTAIGNAFALSRDGTSLIYNLLDYGGGIRIRNLTNGSDNKISGASDFSAEGFPFFSWDGSEVGCVLGRGLFSVPVIGGTKSDLAEGELVFRLFQGADWGEEGEIVFANSGNPLNLVSADGSDSKKLTKLGTDIGHVWPQFLPDGKHVLYIALNEISGTPRGRVEIVNTKTLECETLNIEECSYARYVESGHLLYVVEDEVHGVAFDSDKLSVGGNHKIVLQGVLVNQQGRAQFDVSDDGTLVYLDGTGFGNSGRTLVWVDKKGTISPFTSRRGAWTAFDLSRNEQRVALEIDGDIWILDRAGDSLRPLTKDKALDKWPIWSTDNESVYFYSNRDGIHALWKKVADFSDSRVERICAFGSTVIHPTSVSADDSYLLAFQMDREGDFDIWNIFLRENPIAEPLMSEDYYEGWPMLSSDEDWIAYLASEANSNDLYIRPLNGLEGSLQVSSIAGAVRPKWSSDDRQLFYESGGEILSVALIHQNGEFIRGNSKPELRLPKGAVHTQWTISSDDQRFLVLVDAVAHRSDNEQPFGQTHLKMVSNWFTALHKLVPIE